MTQEAAVTMVAVFAAVAGVTTPLVVAVDRRKQRRLEDKVSRLEGTVKTLRDLIVELIDRGAKKP